MPGIKLIINIDDDDDGTQIGPAQTKATPPEIPKVSKRKKRKPHSKQSIRSNKSIKSVQSISSNQSIKSDRSVGSWSSISSLDIDSHQQSSTSEQQSKVTISSSTNNCTIINQQASRPKIGSREGREAPEDLEAGTRIDSTATTKTDCTKKQNPAK